MERSTTPSRDPRLVMLIFLGGALGTAARALIGTALRAAHDWWPWPTFLVNITGAFALGALLEALLLRGPETGSRRMVRLTLGTGFLGGYTTYSAFAVEVVRLPPALAVGYAGATVSLGLLAATAGFALARRISPGRGVS